MKTMLTLFPFALLANFTAHAQKAAKTSEMPAGMKAYEEAYARGDVSALANLTMDVSTVTVHFGNERVQEWLLVRMPEPPPADAPPKAPDLKREVPPATQIPVKTKP